MAVGFIALAGVAAETGVIMLIHMDHALEAMSTKRQAEGTQLSLSDLNDTIVEGAVERVRPKDDDRGCDHGWPAVDHVELWHLVRGDAPHRRPMVGGMVSSIVMTLVVISLIYALVERRQYRPLIQAGNRS